MGSAVTLISFTDFNYRDILTDSILGVMATLLIHMFYWQYAKCYECVYNCIIEL